MDVENTACDFAALSPVLEDAAVLTTEFKVNLLSPAKVDRFIARDRVDDGDGIHRRG